MAKNVRQRVKTKTRKASKRGSSARPVAKRKRNPAPRTGKKGRTIPRGNKKGPKSSKVTGRVKRKRSARAKSRLSDEPIPLSVIARLALGADQAAEVHFVDDYSRMVERELGHEATRARIRAREIAYNSDVFQVPPDRDASPKTINSPAGVLSIGVEKAWFLTLWALFFYLTAPLFVARLQQDAKAWSRLKPALRLLEDMDLLWNEFVTHDPRGEQLRVALLRFYFDIYKRVFGESVPYKPEPVLLDTLIMAFGVKGQETVLYQGQIPRRKWVVAWITSILRSSGAYKRKSEHKLQKHVANRRDLLNSQKAKKGARIASAETFGPNLNLWLRFILHDPFALASDKPSGQPHIK